MELQVLVSIALALVGGIALALLWHNRKRSEHADQLAQATLREQSLQMQIDNAQAQLHQSQQMLQKKQQTLGQLQAEHDQTKDSLNLVNLQKARLEEQVRFTLEEKQALAEFKDKYEAASQELSDLGQKMQSEQARREEMQKAHDEKIALLEASEARLQEQFENLANKIFQAKSEKFSKDNRQGLTDLLSPLKSQLEGFQKQISDQYIKEGQERASLKTEILGLQKLNQQITAEASALTKALKGDNKQQGNWGEMVLEKILEESGLREGHEYVTQESLKSVDGKTFQPDVVVHLPQEKDVVIDSKVSLAAYERYYAEEQDDLRQRHLKEHIASLKGHIKELGKKNYHDLEGVRSLDYVLLFVPIESAFLLAVDDAPELVKLAMDNNILLVSPTNLLVALRTIHNIWQYEYQNQNAQTIAKKAADLYDKFHGFVTDIEKLGDNLATVQKRYNDATSKLYLGRGNLVKRIEDFRKMGVQTNKKLDTKILDKAEQVDPE